MPIWATTNFSSHAVTQNVSKSRVTTVKLNANGLMPSSIYTFWCNGTDMTWACRTPGTRQGAGLVSDSSGSMTVYFSAEIADDASTAAGGNTTKYNSMQLKNINGDVHSFAVSAQQIIGKKQ